MGQTLTKPLTWVSPYNLLTRHRKMVSRASLAHACWSNSDKALTYIARRSLCTPAHRKMVKLLLKLDDWYTTEAAAPVILHYAHAINWVVEGPAAVLKLEVRSLPGVLFTSTNVFPRGW
jgi:hypothetical protein